jgi:hypothetical protein
MPKLRKIIFLGFNEEYFSEALLKLSKAVIDLNY